MYETSGKLNEETGKEFLIKENLSLNHSSMRMV